MLDIGRIKNYLSSSSKESTARLALTWSLVLASFMFLVITFYISYSLYKSLPIEWYGLSTFVGSLSSFIGVTVWGKVVQRKYEGNGNGYNGDNDDFNGGVNYGGTVLNNPHQNSGGVVINNISAKRGSGISTGPEGGGVEGGDPAV